ncbi:MAG: glycine--tRNA ligase [Phycisphaerales bacterium]|nr:MAG: glycine--tRNA ligase [Phycisphaerales bacterium]
MSGSVADGAKSMDDLMSLCKRRGFVYPASEIYGGLNGFWDYGPLGAQLKKNLADRWWQDMTLTPPMRDGQPVRIVGLDSAIIQNPRVWEASGHVGGFNDPMVDCTQTKFRYRADHLVCLGRRGNTSGPICVYVQDDEASLKAARKKLERATGQTLDEADLETCPFVSLSAAERAIAIGPDATKPGTLTEPRAFNLMFQTYVGATAGEEDKAYLRPETAQGIFVNFATVVDTMRVRVPFGIAQIGKAFRNEVTPRNFIFRSREFEQMEMEFFCHRDEARQWLEYWVQQRRSWWTSVGLSEANLSVRRHEADELAHYARQGHGTYDIEYRWPFTHPGFGELEGVAHRGNFDLTQHEQHSGKKLAYFDQERNERYLPDVIEPAAGLTRGVLALLCEAFTPDPGRPSKVVMRFHPTMAPIKAAVYPLVNKDGMPEVAERLAGELRRRFGHLGLIEYDAKQSIGKRYARMDEAGCPVCFTIDGQTLEDQTVTARDRDTLAQERIALDRVGTYLAHKLGQGEN